MVFEPLQLLIPIGRFGSLLWLVVAGFLLPTSRHTAGSGDRPHRADGRRGTAAMPVGLMRTVEHQFTARRR